MKKLILILALMEVAIAQTPPILSHGTDTLILRVVTTGADSVRWYSKSGGTWTPIAGATADSLIVVAGSADYVNKNAYKCRAYNSVGTKDSKEWILGLKNNKRIINRK